MPDRPHKSRTPEALSLASPPQSEPAWRRWLTRLTPSSGIIPSAGASGLPLVMVVAAMSFLATLSFGSALAISQSISDWTTQLTGTATVQIKPSSVMPPEEQMDAVVDVLSSTPGVLTAHPISRTESAKLLEPWLGGPGVTDDLPIPQLIDVSLDPDNLPDLDELARRLQVSAPGAVLDTHHHWRSELLSATRTAQALAFGILALVIATTIAIVISATRAGLSSNRDVIEVLHLIGAKDQFIATEVQRHFLLLGLRGGIIGLGAGIIVFTLAAQLGGLGGAFFLPLQQLSGIQYVWLMLIPLAVALAAMLTARATVLSAIGRMM